ncbi:putative adhesin [Vibrio aestuarianus]|uniref:Putative adhesin Stv domain-containing protein n=1 Tax=Vibrio aestuarianus TaxID=28171 RepID=A0A9X4FBD7_9VIBR|nr:hypothetical protein [Vibrio aestuarianus]MDE1236630.1 hypothetical protein [Vibrio aestuarianus]MDE1247516.1 hypothetical protein [Vibrio aestuarianus]MDE1347948.1 hypothetical protein [Vibrio aestuarianus]NGZ64735.1 hypothetical protein [Vibrio aestuarianus subsp. cardii]
MPNGAYLNSQSHLRKSELSIASASSSTESSLAISVKSIRNTSEEPQGITNQLTRTRVFHQTTPTPIHNRPSDSINPIFSWANSRGLTLSCESSNKRVFTWDIGNGIRIHTKVDSLSKKLVITAHGDYSSFKKNIMPIPKGVQLTFLGPHNYDLKDPALVNSTSNKRTYASISEGGVTPHTNQAKRALDSGQIKDITGSSQDGMMANYNLHYFEGDGIHTIEDTISGNIDLNALYNELEPSKKSLFPMPPEPHDVLSLSEGTSLSLGDVLSRLKEKGIHYSEIKMCFCRGRSGVTFKGSGTHETESNVKGKV